MKSSVLIITPYEEWAQKALLASSLATDYAPNGKEGQLKIYKGSYDYVFVGLDTQDTSGLEVIRYIRSKYPLIKIFALVESKSLLELGTDDVLLKKMGVTSLHFDLPAEDINKPIKALGAIKKWEEVTEVEGAEKDQSETKIEDEKFTRIQIDEFFESTVAVFDFYIRLGSGRYIKIVHKGERPSIEQIRKYAGNGVRHLYFLNVDRADFISYQNELTSKMLKKSDVSEGKILKALKSVTDKYLDEAVVQGIQPQLVEEGKVLTQNMYDFVQRDKGLKKVLGQLEEFNPAAYSHSFLVCFFSNVICRNLSWVGPRTREAMTLGALFHDVGLIQLPEAIVQKQIDSMTENELIVFQQHPKKGEESLEGIPSVNISIRQIVLQHHEFNDGSGYPLGLPGQKIYPLAKIVGLADSFSDYITDRGCSPLDGLKGFLVMRENIVRHDAELMKNLVKGFISDRKI